MKRPELNRLPSYNNEYDPTKEWMVIQLWDTTTPKPTNNREPTQTNPTLGKDIENHTVKVSDVYTDNDSDGSSPLPPSPTNTVEEQVSALKNDDADPSAQNSTS